MCGKPCTQTWPHCAGITEFLLDANLTFLSVTIGATLHSCAQTQREPAIQQPVQLEQWLMEGAYNKVLAAVAGAPKGASDHAALLLAQLATTVR